ncbi:hypothetical protein GCM10017781_06150 [Deinococcus metalli]|uniref:Uncharacterized protein n=1 Tax=Deinococcus metalli TaxID=1141878 RepID=A0ABQ3JHV5_9DEIO|nr:hypothetical protein GCM10017781_06150 [Deinococcus metalli]
MKQLEAQRRAFETSHVRRSELPGVLLAVFQIVQEEAGTPAFQRIAGRMVRAKAAQVAALARGRT